MSANAKKVLALAALTVSVALGLTSLASASDRVTGMPPGSHKALRGGGMWIWYVNDSQGGSVSRIAAKAKAHGISTLFVKGADGSTTWSQFSSNLVNAFHRKGIKVCAWQYVYGYRPVKEADAAARAIARGADCFVIDAETEYQGRYRQAVSYVKQLRSKVGKDYPIGLSGFPYVDYHPSFPYSVFLGPGGAQYNLPQIYWHTIGDSVDWSFRHTFIYNRVYEAPIRPLGQVYNRPPVREVRRFRALASTYGMTGVSWWSWQSASTGAWSALKPGSPAAISNLKPTSQFPVVKRTGSNSKGDLVVWAQLHLVGAKVLSDREIDGRFGSLEASAVRRFQSARGLPVTGVIDRATWRKLLTVTPYRLTFTNRAGSRARPGLEVPSSAKLPALGYEIPATGRG